ncbi:ABC transporter permease [Neolewinella litorea]|uniref:ABC transporter permease n=1 Tax=Neolewinella litorea TaxID=2562452 RepID=A0A4S4NU29_9BACT|nr:ABC transporter permease [Neolewinella litorea]THH41978.1 ABC transporter permease [Neolewinella litorea]
MKQTRWAYGFLFFLVAIALGADFIAGDKPLVAQVDGELYFPVLDGTPQREAWSEVPVDWAVWPPIPFRASSLDLSQPGYLPPLSRATGGRGWHWLGTDRLGRDTAAGIVSGTRVAVWVGIGSVLISLLLGLPLGSLAGYFGNDGMRLHRGGAIALLMGLVTGLFYGATTLFALAGGWIFWLLLGLTLVAAWSFWYLLLRGIARWVPWLRTPVGLPIDSIVVVLLEITVSIPGLVLLIALLSYVDRASLWVVVLTIGVLGWTPVARFLRAELLRIRELPYIAAARVGGVGELRLLFRHALPNAIGPVVVVAAFMVGTSILAEAMLSFLGIGVPADQVTWGSILQQSRVEPDAWWLAFFPGLLLTLTLLACNSLRQVR